MSFAKPLEIQELKVYFKILEVKFCYDVLVYFFSCLPSNFNELSKDRL
jgi:hypothetical protein